MIFAQNISKSFGNNIVLDDISFHVQKGSICGLIGPNGGGKTTLMKILSGLISPEYGFATIDGDNLDQKHLKIIRKKIGYVPQNNALYMELNGYENLSYFGSILGIRNDLLKKEIQRVINLVNLQDHIKKRVLDYSGGMQKRLNFAIGLLGNPPILYLDEPTVGVDPHTRNVILEVLSNLQKLYNTTIIFTSHYLEEVEKICDQLIVLNEGRVIAEDKTESLLESFKTVDIVFAKPLNLPNNPYDKQLQISFPYRSLKNVMPMLLDNLDNNEILNIQYGSGTLDRYIEKISQKESL
jgi:ABC-2 type transport system ATP-binding protein